MTNDLLDALAKPPPPPSELDELMSRDPMDMTKDDIDKIIAVQREARARREAPAGGRGRSKLKEAEGGMITLAELGLGKPTTAPSPSLKPTAGGFRRL
jgi:hypothetical protein